MIDCKEAAYLTDKKQFSKLSVLQRVNLRLHLFMCDVCRKYGKDSRALNKILKYTSINIPKLTDEDKQRIKENIKQ